LVPIIPAHPLPTQWAGEYLTNAEVDRVIKAAGAKRNGPSRRYVLVACRHGLRPVGLVA
jgi:hypothetical protein